ncbi:MAG TPA: nucleoside-diphosphate-sugar pyrophosphorylase [Prevotellaceae bacterium]|jgi:NDP-sugar pyrophosphorylase family protein|nr:nucleoside-diphosphate-sugar pyrophosphorylase [Prevotellaceae bacterium]
MKFGIIAAGEGSRLKQEGLTTDKPLIRLNGIPLLCRLINIFTSLNASDIVVIVNPLMPAVVNYVKQLRDNHQKQNLCPVTIVEKATKSSMHSFYEISPYLSAEPFCLTTIDTVFHKTEFRDYITAFSTFEGDGLMAVTDFVDDEKPLYVSTASDMTIDGFYDTPHECKYISGGIYCLKPAAITTLKRCVAEGQSRMRNFQRQLVLDGMSLKAYPFTKILDVDHVSDIRKAEMFLAN